MSQLQPREAQPRNYTPWIITLTIVLNLVIVVVFFMPKYQGLRHLDLTFLPMMNAIFNSFTFVFLCTALYFIKQKNIRYHRRFIFAAFTSTLLFLATYLAYHINAESTPYGGEGPLKYLYYFILITHITLAVPTVLLALWTAAYGLNLQTSKHRKIARITLPLWLYVSLTGVLVYLLISPYY
jgi:putative membrane protein